MILRARIVVTMDGPPVENGAVLISGNRVVDVGEFPEISARYFTQKIVDLGERALLPGLINAHCHLDYTCLRGKIRPQKCFADWIRAINSAKAKLTPENYVASIREGVAEAAEFGTTTIANLCAFPELIAQIDESIRIWWFGELIDVRSPDRANQIVDLAVGSLKSKRNWGLAPHALFTASPDLFHRCEEIAQHEHVLLTTHLAESREEFSMFHDGSGSLYEFMKEIGRDMNDCGHETPLALFLGGADSPPQIRPALKANALSHWILVHLNELSERDFDCLTIPTQPACRRATTEFTVVNCPRSHKYFGHSPFQVEKFRDHGLNICLGTDSLASNHDLSLFAEMREFHANFPGISPEEILAMVTKNAARALLAQSLLGEIKPGAFADLIAVPAEGGRDIFEQIIAFPQAVSWSMRDGVLQEPP